MQRSELTFPYPESLIATSPQRPSRVMLSQQKDIKEISIQELLQMPKAGDLWIVNETKVIKRRIFVGDLEILFLQQESHAEFQIWQVLFASKKYRIGQEFELPEGLRMILVEKGRPQKVKVMGQLTDPYFEKYGEVPLPPYIQKARDERHQKNEDLSWYQTSWAKTPGSLAAPTASLHFSQHQLEGLQARGVSVLKTTLHVGLGTFLPVKHENLKDHPMHAEWVEVADEVWQKIQNAKKNGQRIWCLGTTVARALESVARGLLPKNSKKDFAGETRLILLPGEDFYVVDVLMTNFHQPESTLLALVAAFSDLDHVKTCYQWAIGRKFRLFSYGDLSVWIK